MGSARKITVYIFAVILIVWSLIPIYWFANMSFMFDVEVSSIPSHLYPYQPIIANYLRMLGYSTTAQYGNETVYFRPSGYSEAISKGILNSSMLAGIVTAVTLAIATPVGYAFGRYRFRFKNSLLMTLLFTRALPPISVLIPFFFLYQVLGLHGTIVGLVIIYLSITIPLISWVLMGFFATLPVETERAARVDGCSRIGALAKVVVPMASAGIGTTAILTFLISWNEFLFAWLLTQGTNGQTLPPEFPAMLFGVIDNTGLFAATVIGLIPPIIISLLFGRFIVRLRIVDPVTTIGQ